MLVCHCCARDSSTGQTVFTPHRLQQDGLAYGPHRATGVDGSLSPPCRHKVAIYQAACLSKPVWWHIGGGAGRWRVRRGAPRRMPCPKYLQVPLRAGNCCETLTLITNGISKRNFQTLPPCTLLHRAPSPFITLTGQGRLHPPRLRSGSVVMAECISQHH